jgi:TIR domain-containing protein
LVVSGWVAHPRTDCVATAIKYRAFLSYSHRDKAWAEWLQAALEAYRIDGDLVGRDTPLGRVPKTLRPIFRDREDFSAGHSLTEQTLAALEASEFLIVLCSPAAATSKYVNEEVRRFKEIGRSGRVIPVIIDGEPGKGERECFPLQGRCRRHADAGDRGADRRRRPAGRRRQGRRQAEGGGRPDRRCARRGPQARRDRMAARQDPDDARGAVGGRARHRVDLPVLADARAEPA